MALTHWGMFPLFLKRTADVMALYLSVVFRRLVRLGSFLACWRQTNVTPIPNGPPSSSVANFRPISITSVLSKVFERLVSVPSWTNYGMQWCAPNHQVCVSEMLDTCEVLLCMFHTMKSALESGPGARFVQIDFSAAFESVNHQGILY